MICNLFRPSSSDDDDGTSVTSNQTKTNLMYLAGLRIASGYFSQLFLTSLIFLPFVCFFFIIMSMNPVYFKGCVGCALNVTSELLYGFTVLIMGTLISFGYRRLRKFPDPLEIRKGILRCLLTALFFVASSLILVYMDPGNATYNGTFHYGLLALIGTGGGQFWLCGYQVIRSLQLRSAKNVTLNYGDGANPIFFISMKDILADSSLLKEFEEYLTHEFAQESLLFLLVVNSYYKKIAGYSSEVKKSKANLIFKTFISTESSIQINLPSKIFEDLESYFESSKFNALSEIDQNIFMPATIEITELLEKGSLKRFILKKYKDGNSSILLNPIKESS